MLRVSVYEYRRHTSNVFFLRVCISYHRCTHGSSSIILNGLFCVSLFIIIVLRELSIKTLNVSSSLYYHTKNKTILMLITIIFFLTVPIMIFSEYIVLCITMTYELSLILVYNLICNILELRIIIHFFNIVHSDIVRSIIQLYIFL